MAIALLTALGLGLANFAYQGLTAQAWALAMERTWFQATACLTVAAAEYIVSRSMGEGLTLKLTGALRCRTRVPAMRRPVEFFG